MSARRPPQPFIDGELPDPPGTALGLTPPFVHSGGARSIAAADPPGSSRARPMGKPGAFGAKVTVSPVFLM